MAVVFRTSPRGLSSSFEYRPSAVDRSLSNFMNESIETGTRLAVAADPPFFSSESCVLFVIRPVQPTANGFEKTPFRVCIFSFLYPKNKIPGILEPFLPSASWTSRSLIARYVRSIFADKYMSESMSSDGERSKEKMRQWDCVEQPHLLVTEKVENRKPKAARVG